jgi:hypothetical protein
MEDIQDETPGLFTFSVVDASTREGVKRLQELRPTEGRQNDVSPRGRDGQNG